MEHLTDRLSRNENGKEQKPTYSPFLFAVVSYLRLVHSVQVLSCAPPFDRFGSDFDNTAKNTVTCHAFNCVILTFGVHFHLPLRCAAHKRERLPS